MPEGIEISGEPISGERTPDCSDVSSATVNLWRERSRPPKVLEYNLADFAKPVGETFPMDGMAIRANRGCAL